MNLDVSFILSSSVLIAAIVPLYIYREKVFPFIYKSGNFNLFIQDIQIFLTNKYPNVKFNYETITEKTKDEKDIRIRETLVVEDLVKQYFNKEYEKKTQGSVNKEKLWSSYSEFSKSNSKFPNDWQSRKELAFARDNGKCNRCGTKIKLNDASTVFVKDIESGGGYNLENIIILCSDCQSVLNSKNPNSTMNNLLLTDKLMNFVSN